ncbi:MAG TPA: hypothetical protein QF873_00870, partial [Patescibacteria group bacterium]|nr:hypothetical protein [Patescibacteria group bacterium]
KAFITSYVSDVGMRTKMHNLVDTMAAALKSPKKAAAAPAAAVAAPAAVVAKKSKVPPVLAGIFDGEQSPYMDGIDAGTKPLTFPPRKKAEKKPIKEIDLTEGYKALPAFMVGTLFTFLALTGALMFVTKVSDNYMLDTAIPVLVTLIGLAGAGFCSYLLMTEQTFTQIALKWDNDLDDDGNVIEHEGECEPVNEDDIPTDGMHPFAAMLEKARRYDRDNPS